METQRLREFHDTVYQGYQSVLSGERNVLFKMKELWGFLIHSCPEEEKLMKKIRKAQHLAEYEGVVSELFCRMREHE
jgi:hypothetical protein